MAAPRLDPSASSAAAAGSRRPAPEPAARAGACHHPRRHHVDPRARGRDQRRPRPTSCCAKVGHRANLTLCYEAGIQWRAWRDTMDVITGRGIDRQIERAYGVLASRYRPGDRIYLIGYSRGAYAVRSLAGIVDLVGLLRRRRRQRAQRPARFPPLPPRRRQPGGGGVPPALLPRGDADRGGRCLGHGEVARPALPFVWRLTEAQHAFHNHALGPTSATASTRSRWMKSATLTPRSCGARPRGFRAMWSRSGSAARMAMSAARSASSSTPARWPISRWSGCWTGWRAAACRSPTAGGTVSPGCRGTVHRHLARLEQALPRPPSPAGRATTGRSGCTRAWPSRPVARKQAADASGGDIWEQGKQGTWMDGRAGRWTGERGGGAAERVRPPPSHATRCSSTFGAMPSAWQTSRVSCGPVERVEVQVLDPALEQVVAQLGASAVASRSSRPSRLRWSKASASSRRDRGAAAGGEAAARRPSSRSAGCRGGSARRCRPRRRRRGSGRRSRPRRRTG